MIDLINCGYHLPKQISNIWDWASEHTNTDHAKALELNGACDFHTISGDDSLADMATSAIDKALTRASIAPEDVDLLLMYQTSPCSVLPFPNTLLGEVRLRAGLTQSWAMGVSQQQCVSFVHAIKVAQALFRADSSRGVAMIVGVDTILAEPMRAIGDAGIHSDAASAMIVGRPGMGKPITGIETYNDPRVVSAVDEDGRFEANPNYLWSLVSILRRILKSAGRTHEEIASILPHNVNRQAWRQALQSLRIPEDKLFESNFERIGHAFGSDAAINIHDSGALSTQDSHLVFSSGIGGCFGGFILGQKEAA